MESTMESDSNSSKQPTVEVDWLRQQNTSRHHTNEYENVALVLRRGETFNVGLTFKDIDISEIPKTVFKLRIGMSIRQLCFKSGTVNIS